MKLHGVYISDEDLNTIFEAILDRNFKTNSEKLQKIAEEIRYKVDYHFITNLIYGNCLQALVEFRQKLDKLKLLFVA